MCSGRAGRRRRTPSGLAGGNPQHGLQRLPLAPLDVPLDRNDSGGRDGQSRDRIGKWQDDALPEGELGSAQEHDRERGRRQAGEQRIQLKAIE